MSLQCQCHSECVFGAIMYVWSWPYYMLGAIDIYTLSVTTSYMYLEASSVCSWSCVHTPPTVFPRHNTFSWYTTCSMYTDCMYMCLHVLIFDDYVHVSTHMQCTWMYCDYTSMCIWEGERVCVMLSGKNCNTSVCVCVNGR